MSIYWRHYHTNITYCLLNLQILDFVSTRAKVDDRKHIFLTLSKVHYIRWRSVLLFPVNGLLLHNN